MGTVADYHASIEDPQRRAALEHIADLVRDSVPEAVEGTSYAMPAFLHRGKGLLAVMATKEHLALYPYSGSVLPSLEDRIVGFSHSAGTLRFQAEDPPSDDLVLDLVARRRAEIDERLDRPRRR